MNKPLIYHICSTSSWADQSHSEEYLHTSLKEEKFIHCSEKQQISGVLERYFKDQSDLLILTIDASAVHPRVQYDKAPCGENFPHIYGPLNKDAIIEIKQLNDLKTKQWITSKS